MTSIQLRRIAAFVLVSVSLSTSSSWASSSCKLLSDGAYTDLVKSADQSLNQLRETVDSELLLAEVTIAPEQRGKIEPYTQATSKFLDDVQKTQIFSGFLAEAFVPAEKTLEIKTTQRDRDATQATYRARRDALALLSMLPTKKAFGDKVLDASAKVRQAITDFIHASTPFVVNDNCRYERDLAQRIVRDYRANQAKAATGQKVVECRNPGPLPDLTDTQCADLIRATTGASAVCIGESDENGSCEVEVAKPAPRPAAPSADLASGGICPNQPADSAGGGQLRADAGLGGAPSTGGYGGATLATPQ